MTSEVPNLTFRRIRERAPHRRSVSFTDIDIQRLSRFENTFTAVYTEEVPFSFSKTVSKAVELAFLMVSDPKMRSTEEQFYQESLHEPSLTFRRIREKAPHRRSVSLTDTDIQRLSCLEKTFKTIYTEEVPFSFSSTVSKAVELAYLMVSDPRNLFNNDEEFCNELFIQKLSEEHKELLKYAIENGISYKFFFGGELLTDEDLRYLRAIHGK